MYQLTIILFMKKIPKYFNKLNYFHIDCMKLIYVSNYPELNYLSLSLTHTHTHIYVSTVLLYSIIMLYHIMWCSITFARRQSCTPPINIVISLLIIYSKHVFMMHTFIIIRSDQIQLLVLRSKTLVQWRLHHKSNSFMKLFKVYAFQQVCHDNWWMRYMCH